MSRSLGKVTAIERRTGGTVWRHDFRPSAQPELVPANPSGSQLCTEGGSFNVRGGMIVDSRRNPLVSFHKDPRTGKFTSLAVRRNEPDPGWMRNEPDPARWLFRRNDPDPGLATRAVVIALVSGGYVLLTDFGVAYLPPGWSEYIKALVQGGVGVVAGIGLLRLNEDLGVGMIAGGVVAGIKRAVAAVQVASIVSQFLGTAAAAAPAAAAAAAAPAGAGQVPSSEALAAARKWRREVEELERIRGVRGVSPSPKVEEHRAERTVKELGGGEAEELTRLVKELRGVKGVRGAPVGAGWIAGDIGCPTGECLWDGERDRVRAREAARKTGFRGGVRR